MYETTLTRKEVVKHRFNVGDILVADRSIRRFHIVVDRIDWYSRGGSPYPCYWTPEGHPYAIERVDKHYELAATSEPRFNVGDIVIRQALWAGTAATVCVVESNSDGWYQMRDVLDPSLLVNNPHKAVDSDVGFVYTKIGETCD